MGSGAAMTATRSLQAIRLLSRVVNDAIHVVNHAKGVGQRMVTRRLWQCLFVSLLCLYNRAGCRGRGVISITAGENGMDGMLLEGNKQI